MSKMEIALYAATFGWALAQATELLRSYFRIRSKKASIVDELFELKMLLTEGAESARRSALNYGKHGDFSYSLGSQLSTPVFDSFYHEVADKFTDWQRFNIRTFHNHLTFYNNLVRDIREIKSGSLSQNEVVLKIFEAYKQASFSVIYLEACDESGGKEKLTNNHPKIEALREKIKEDVEQVLLTKS